MASNLQLPPGALMMKLDHKHIQGLDIKGCFGVAVQQQNGLKILTVGGISNLEDLAADIYANAVIGREVLGAASLTYLEDDPEKLTTLAERSIEAAVIFKQVLMDRAKEESKPNAKTQTED